MIGILWRYQIRPQYRGEFEAAYGPAGDWAKLFGRSEAFRGTRLLRGSDDQYLTLDCWLGRGDFDLFLAEHGDDYRALDERTEGWTELEERLGIFDLLD